MTHSNARNKQKLKNYFVSVTLVNYRVMQARLFGAKLWFSFPRAKLDCSLFFKLKSLLKTLRITLENRSSSTVNLVLVRTVKNNYFRCVRTNEIFFLKNGTVRTNEYVVKLLKLLLSVLFSLIPDQCHEKLSELE